MNNFEIKKWEPNLDLTEFYTRASQRGFVNNADQKSMIDCFRNEREWNAWVLYYNENPVGSVAAHSFDIMGPDSYRVLTRVCTFGEQRNHKGLIKTKKLVAEHQNLTDQFLLPACISWTGCEKNLYATSNNSSEASQRLVHKFYFPTLEKIGLVKRKTEVKYRGLKQTVWQIFPKEFLNHLNQFPRW